MVTETTDSIMIQLTLTPQECNDLLMALQETKKKVESDILSAKGYSAFMYGISEWQKTANRLAELETRINNQLNNIEQ